MVGKKQQKKNNLHEVRVLKVGCIFVINKIKMKMKDYEIMLLVPVALADIFGIFLTHFGGHRYLLADIKQVQLVTAETRAFSPTDFSFTVSLISSLSFIRLVYAMFTLGCLLNILVNSVSAFLHRKETAVTEPITGCQMAREMQFKTLAMDHM